MAQYNFRHVMYEFEDHVNFMLKTMDPSLNVPVRGLIGFCPGRSADSTFDVHISRLISNWSQSGDLHGGGLEMPLSSRALLGQCRWRGHQYFACVVGDG